MIVLTLSAFALVVLLGAMRLAIASFSTAPTWQKAWYWQNPNPQGNTLLRVAAGTSNLWAVGGPGVVLFSSDGGAVWDAQDPQTSLTLRAVDFVDDQSGWAVGDGATIRTTADGGSTWTTQTSDVPLDQALRGVSMVDGQTGWVVGDGGIVLKTTDSGTTWIDQTAVSVQLNDVSAVDASHAWTVGAVFGGFSTIRATSDGGTTWATQAVPTTSTLTAVNFVDSQTGYAVGAAVGGEGTILKTVDGGSSWTTVSAGTTQDLTDVEFVSSTTGWITESDSAGAAGAIRYTTDGGTTWILQASGARGINGLAALSGSSASAVGCSGVMMRTNDTGATWPSGTFATVGHLLDVAFLDTTSGWAAGAGGTIVRTDDGGASWFALVSGTDVTLRGLDMVSANLGWVVGDDGTVLGTTDGSAWTPQASGVATDLLGVDFVDANTGWAVGNEATIRVTTDGGATWTAQDSGLTTSTPLYGVSMVTAQTGWAWGGADGVAGLLLHTTDGGSTWSRQDPGVATGVVLRAGAFLDANTGWVGGSGGIVCKTTDGGSTWIADSAGTTADILGMKFVDANTGIIVGNTGGATMSLVRKTTDGGSTWIAETPGTANALRAVDFVDTDTGWVVGDSGTILRTTDGTPPTTDLSVSPAPANGANGWYVTTPTVTLSANEPAITYFSWASSDGPWAMYSVPMAHAVDGTSTVHYYSIDQSGNRESLKGDSFRFDPDPPTVPGTPTVSPIATDTVTISWPGAVDSVSGVGSYEVLVNGSPQQTTSVASATVSGLATETAYSFSVIAVDVAGNVSAESSPTTAVTLAPRARPPAAVYAREVGSRGVFVDWCESTGTVPPVEYRVWRAVGGGSFSVIATSGAGESHSYSDTSPPLFEQLSYRVSAIDARGEGSPSEPTALSATVTTALPAPASVTASETASVLVTWTPVPLVSVAGYHVYRSTTSTGALETQTVVPVVPASYYDTRTADYTEYWYRVATVDASGNVGVPSSPVYIRTDASGTVAPPHGAYTQDTDFCALCHSAHTSSATQVIQAQPGSEATLTRNALLRGTSTIDAPLCLSCHDGTSASDVLGDYDDPGRSSRHAVPVAGNAGILVCASCHAVHAAAATSTAKGLISAGGSTSGNPFCYACHGASAGSNPRGDLRGFEGSAHSTGVAEPPTGTKVVCLSCHVSHSSHESALYPYSGDDRCLGCHSAGTTSDATADIAGRLAGPGPDTRHDLRSFDSSMTGSRLACGNCHEPHAASATTPCVDPYNPSTSGGISAGDAFCLKCHSGSLPKSADTSGWVAAPLAEGGSTSTTNIASAWVTSVHGAGVSADVHLRPQMGFSAGDSLVCASCHDAHGSPNRFALLDTVRAKNSTLTADALLVVPLPSGGSDLRFFCGSCHDLSSTTHPKAVSGGADLDVFPIDCTASGCHNHVGHGL